jgi:hypothetical protein
VIEKSSLGGDDVRRIDNYYVKRDMPDLTVKRVYPTHL